MINHKITCQIIEKLQERFSLPISICDLSGRTIASTEPSCIGEMNLLAIESLNLNAKVTTAPGTYFQNASTAVPLRLQGSRIGAVVIEPSSSANLHMAELLGNTIELLYEELLSSFQQSVLHLPDIPSLNHHRVRRSSLRVLYDKVLLLPACLLGSQ